MPVRATMFDLINRVSIMIADPANAQFTMQQVQDKLDEYRDDIRYLALAIAPTIVNTASTNNQASTIFADYYSVGYQWWEQDAVLQGTNTGTGAAWVVLTPLASDYITGHWQFELTPFTNGTIPGQYPPCFATGKTYDLYAASADLLEFWAATLAGSYDVTVDGQTLRRSQLMQAKLTMAQYYRRQAKPRITKMVRSDVMPDIGSRRYRLLDSDDVLKGS
ncbi:MAG: hypothetical protein ACRDHZ_02415 [Ktedonobacteraceae bacterium]